MGMTPHKLTTKVQKPKKKVSNLFFCTFFRSFLDRFKGGTVESPNRSSTGQVDKTAASPSPVPEPEEISNKDMEEQVSFCSQRASFYVCITKSYF